MAVQEGMDRRSAQMPLGVRLKAEAGRAGVGVGVEGATGSAGQWVSASRALVVLGCSAAPSTSSAALAGQAW